MFLTEIKTVGLMFQQKVWYNTRMYNIEIICGGGGDSVGPGSPPAEFSSYLSALRHVLSYHKTCISVFDSTDVFRSLSYIVLILKSTLETNYGRLLLIATELYITFAVHSIKTSQIGVFFS